MQKPKIKLQIVIFLKYWVVFTVSSFVGKINYLFIINVYALSNIHVFTEQLKDTASESQIKIFKIKMFSTTTPLIEEI